jgi:hypothetical protein
MDSNNLTFQERQLPLGLQAVREQGVKMFNSNYLDQVAKDLVVEWEEFLEEA